MLEFKTFEREKGGWKGQNSLVRRGRGRGGSFPRPFSLLCFALPILPFLSQTFRVQSETQFPQSPIMTLVRLDNVILVLVLSLGFEVYPSVGIYVCQIKGIDVAKMSFYRY